jgi:hypothetical protein
MRGDPPDTIGETEVWPGYELAQVGRFSFLTIRGWLWRGVPILRTRMVRKRDVATRSLLVPWTQAALTMGRRNIVTWAE